MSQDLDLEYIVDRYGEGECGTFAVALSAITKLPIVLFRLQGQHDLHLPDRWPRHAAVEVKRGVFLDASGLVKLEDLRERYSARLFVDREPNLARYPFEGGPGQTLFNDEEWTEAETHALNMMRCRGLHELADTAEVDRIMQAEGLRF